MTNLLTGHEDYIVSHTRKEIMQKFNVNYNYVSNFCHRNGLKPIAERGRYHVTDEMKDFLKEHTVKETAHRFHVGYYWLLMKIREMNLTCKMHNCKEVKLSTHSCKRTGEAHDMIRYLSKTFTIASIARVFGYSSERIRQSCADNEEYKYANDYITCQEAYQSGAKFGYNKANEWHEIESKVTPKREISKQYMPKNKEKVLLKYHFSGDDEIHISDGYYDAYDFEFHIANNPKFRIVCVIAWREIVLPELSKEIKEKCELAE
jgi:hypothetical protein